MMRLFAVISWLLSVATCGNVQHDQADLVRPLIGQLRLLPLRY